jgi:repressor LexA
MPTDRDYLAALQNYYAHHRSIPSLSTLGQIVNLRSKSSVSALVGRLKLAGVLESTPDRRLAPTRRFFDRAIVDTVPAGLPSPANEPPAESISIDEYLVTDPGRTVLLVVRGDSMLDAGLLPGDTIVVRRGVPAKIGDIVVAIVDNEFTVKYLAQDKRGIFLKPGNPAYGPIRPQSELEIYGLVTGQFRRYSR